MSTHRPHKISTPAHYLCTSRVGLVLLLLLFTCGLQAQQVTNSGTNNNGDRTLTFLNQCPGQSLHLGVTGGRVRDCGPGNSCPEGTSCLVQAEGAVGCFWDFPPGNRFLPPGGRTEVQLLNPPIETAPGSLFKWSGTVYASTGCNSLGDGCETALCPGVDGAPAGLCPNGVGPVGPVTLAEFTLDFRARDFYDISIIDGVNVPISMRPTEERRDPTDFYFCQEAGGVEDSETGLLGCSWSFDPTIEGFGDQGSLLTTVLVGNDRDCSDGCPAGEVCGRELQVGTEEVSEVCGRQIAWWTANELCGHTNSRFGEPLNCARAVPGQGIQTNLHLCNEANSNSCYQRNEADPTCCGCPTWQVDGRTVPVAPGFTCFDSNPSWTRLAEPWAQFLKDGCPSAYTFPFDDATSTFTCETPGTSESNPNSMDYTITFCPDGRTAF